MKNLLKSTVILILFLPTLIFSQTPPHLGTAASFALFTSIGATTNAGPLSQVTGDFGTNSGPVSGFGNVNGQMHISNAISTQAAIDLDIAYANLSNQIPSATVGPLLGFGQVLLPNVYLINGAVSLTDTLILDGCGDPNAYFLFQINGAVTTASYATIILTNGTKACNVFWKVHGAVTMQTYTYFKGTIIAEGAIDLRVGVNLKGRALSTIGAVTVSGVTVGNSCSPPTTGPLSPDMGTVNCFALLSSIGTITNTGTTNITGDIGIDNGTVLGFNPAGVAGLIHSIPDAATAQASIDLNTLYTYLNGLPIDIELLDPILFGNSQVLTPNIYIMNGATVLTDTIFLDAKGIAGAVFVIRILGTFTTNSNPQVILVGGTEAKNVFWQVEGPVTINSGNFNGTIVANNTSIILNTGVTFNGRAFVRIGNITTADANITSTSTASGAASSTPILCTNTVLTDIIHTTTGATDIGTPTGLPVGVTAAWSNNTVTLSGTPTVAGIFNYSISLTGGCSSVNATGTITVTPVTSATPANTTSAPSATPTLCINTELNDIIHATTMATGIGSATDLPMGITATWSANTVTISGTPTNSGTFNYSIPLTGGCGSLNATGTITVTPVTVKTTSTPSSTPPFCLNTPLTYITHTTTGATGIGTATNLPPGITAAWSANTITLSGTPTVAGIFHYSISLTGGCGCSHATGTITISPIPAPNANLTTASNTICHGVQVILSGSVTATGPWTLTLSNGQTTTGSGNGAWNIAVAPTNTTIYTISSIVDASVSMCLGTISGSATLTLPPAGTDISNDNESSTCIVNQAEWVHFYHSSGRLIASINSAGENLGNVSITSYVDATVQTVPDCYNPSIYETIVMQRHWVITPSIQPNLPVQVRLPFKDTEYNNLVSVANSNLNGLDDVSSVNDVKLTKYSGPLNVNSSVIDNCVLNSGSGGATIHIQSANGISSSYSSISNAQYLDFTISGFSEFWLHGSLGDIPLPIELLNFTATAEDGYVQINWATARETNNDYFNIERSADGINFTSIGQINGARNSTQILSYSTIDETPLRDWSYYRLKQTNYNKKISYSNLVAVHFKTINDFIFNVYPNPFSTKTTFRTTENLKDATLTLYNSYGHIVKQRQKISGQTITLHRDNLPSGIYFSRLAQNSIVIATRKLVITD